MFSSWDDVIVWSRDLELVGVGATVEGGSWTRGTWEGGILEEEVSDLDPRKVGALFDERVDFLVNLPRSLVGSLTFTAAVFCLPGTTLPGVRIGLTEPCF